MEKLAFFKAGMRTRSAGAEQKNYNLQTNNNQNRLCNKNPVPHAPFDDFRIESPRLTRRLHANIVIGVDADVIPLQIKSILT